MQLSTSYIAKIISSIGTITDALGVHILTTADFSTGGFVDWYGGQAFVAYLDKTNYGGSSHWALPTTVDSLSSANNPPSPISSQLAELFYSELGGVAGSSIPSGPFSNVQSSSYGSATEFALAPANVWSFYAHNGTQAYGTKQYLFYAWAVTPGLVSAVPVPGAMWLFGTGLLGLRMLRRKS
jgi:hypothetical protein